MSTHSSLSRRATLQRLTGAGAALTATALAHTSAVSQEATPLGMAAHPIVGAWRVVPDQPGPPLVLILYHADGTLIFSAPITTPAEPGASFTVTYDTPAYGAWESTGEREIALSASLIETDEAGRFLGSLNFHGTAQLDDTLESYVYQGVVEVVDPNGGIVATLPVSTRGTRLRVDRARAAGAPGAGTPMP